MCIIFFDRVLMFPFHELPRRYTAIFIAAFFGLTFWYTYTVIESPFKASDDSIYVTYYFINYDLFGFSAFSGFLAVLQAFVVLTLVK